MPSWTRLDLGARYRINMGTHLLTLRAAVETVTDEDYWASAGGFPNASYLVLGMRRTLLVSATLNL